MMSALRVDLTSCGVEGVDVEGELWPKASMECKRKEMTERGEEVCGMNEHGDNSRGGRRNCEHLNEERRNTAGGRRSNRRGTETELAH